MRPTNQMSTNKKTTFSATINTETYQNLIRSTLRDPKRINRFVAAITATVSATPALQDCTPASILSAAFQGEALELSPSPALAHYYIVPYGDKAQFIPGVNGLKQLALRTGLYKDIDAIEIRDGEFKGRDKHNGKPKFEFIEDDNVRENTPIIGYLAYYELNNGYRQTCYFGHEKIVKWADRYSPAFNRATYDKFKSGKMTEAEISKLGSPWYERFDTMAEKTVLKQVLKGAPMSIEMQTAIEADDVDYANNIQSVTFEATEPTEKQVESEFFGGESEEKQSNTARVEG